MTRTPLRTVALGQGRRPWTCVQSIWSTLNSAPPITLRIGPEKTSSLRCHHRVDFGDFGDIVRGPTGCRLAEQKAFVSVVVVGGPTLTKSPTSPKSPKSTRPRCWRAFSTAMSRSVPLFDRDRSFVPTAHVARVPRAAAVKDAAGTRRARPLRRRARHYDRGRWDAVPRECLRGKGGVSKFLTLLVGVPGLEPGTR